MLTFPSQLTPPSGRTVVLNNGEHGSLSLPVRQGMTQPTNQGTNNSNSATPSEYISALAMKQLKEAGEERRRKDEMDAEARKRKDEMDAEDRRRTQNLAAAAAKADADDRRHDKELAAERERAAAERERAAAAERMHGQDLAAEQSKLTQEILLAAISSNNGNGPNEAKYCHTHNSHNSRADEIIGNLDKKVSASNLLNVFEYRNEHQSYTILPSVNCILRWSSHLLYQMGIFFIIFDE